MRKPKTSRRDPDSGLAGSNDESCWVVGRNCVYRDSTVKNYRVSIRTLRGWRSYGHFSDLETATYVANIAILVESCEEKYELFRGVGNKDKDELAAWRRAQGNADLERIAAERYKKIQSELAAALAQGVDRNTAKEIMSEYYKNNKGSLSPDIVSQREYIISLIMEGVRVEEAFARASLKAT